LEFETKELKIDSIFTLYPGDFSQVLLVNTEFQSKLENVTDICTDTLNEGKLIRTFGKMADNDNLYLLSESRLYILVEGMD